DFAVTNDNAPAVAAICQRLDGHPLAIELAAARVKMLSPAALLAKLDSALSVLTSGDRDRPARQQTLRSTIAWSYDALSEPERTLLDRLSVFPGSLTLDAADAVCGPPFADEPAIDVFETMASLVDKSLVRPLEPVGSDPTPRFSLLASIREFAAELLAERGEADAIAARHAAYYSAIAQLPPDWTREQEHEWRLVVQREFHNLAAALAYVQQHGTPEELIAFPWGYYFDLGTLGRFDELLSATSLVLERCPTPHPHRVILRIRRGWTLDNTMATAAAREEYAAALTEAREIGAPDVIAYAGAWLLFGLETRDEVDATKREVDAALAMPVEGWMPSRTECRSIYFSGLSLAARWVDPDRALLAARANLELDMPDVEQIYILSVANGLGCNRGDTSHANALEATVRAFTFDPADEPYQIGAFVTLARANLLTGDVDKAAAYAEDAVRRARRLRHLRLLQMSVTVLADCARTRGDWAAAAAHLSHAMTELRDAKDPVATAALLWREGRCHRAAGDA
ncbi:MAG: hypothetical protein ABR520_09310, partial [Mycobacteriales bacterium]